MFNSQTILQLAHLARLNLSASEANQFLPQIESLLDYVRVIQEVDLQMPGGTRVEPLRSPTQFFPSSGDAWASALREDQVEIPSLDLQGVPTILSSSVSIEESGFKVPQVVERHESS